MEGQVSTIPIEGCGFTYRAKVIQGIKGAVAGDQVHFRLRTGLKVAGRYLVFGDQDELPGEVMDEHFEIVDIRSSVCSSIEGQLTATEIELAGAPYVLVGVLEHYWVESSSDHSWFSEYYVGPHSYSELLVPRNVENRILSIRRTHGRGAAVAFRSEQLLQLLSEIAGASE